MEKKKKLETSMWNMTFYRPNSTGPYVISFVNVRIYMVLDIFFLYLHM